MLNIIQLWIVSAIKLDKNHIDKMYIRGRCCFLRYAYLKKTKRATKYYQKLIYKYLKEGYLTASEVEKYGRKDEKYLIGLGKTRMLTMRMEERLKMPL